MRVYPQVLTDNFKAIEEGDSTLQQWSLNLVRRQSVPGPIANDPTREDDLGWLFTKGGGTEETELYYQDSADPANVIQLTSEGKMGSSTTQAIFQDITIGTTPIDIGVNQQIVAQGSVDGAGNLLAGAINIASVAKDGTGRYDVDITADVLLNNNYRVFAQAYDLTSDSGRRSHVRTHPAPVGGNPTTIRIVITGSSGTRHDERFDIMIVGGR